MSKLEILRKLILYIRCLIKLIGEDLFRKDYKYCVVLELGLENWKIIGKNKLKVDNIMELERRFIVKMNKRVKSFFFDDMMEDMVFDDLNLDIGEED